MLSADVLGGHKQHIIWRHNFVDRSDTNFENYWNFDV